MEEVKRNSLQAWILAARPKTLTGAITPVMIGTALAAMDGRFHWLPALICCLFASLMQIAANFINDLFDFLKGTDREDRLGPERACAQGWISPQAMKTGIIITVALACLIGCTLLFFAGWELIIVGVLCVLFAFLYHRSLSSFLQRLGRCIGDCLFRFCTRRRNILRTGANLDTGCHYRLFNLRTAYRYIVGSQ